MKRGRINTVFGDTLTLHYELVCDDDSVDAHTDRIFEADLVGNSRHPDSKVKVLCQFYDLKIHILI